MLNECYPQGLHGRRMNVENGKCALAGALLTRSGPHPKPLIDRHGNFRDRDRFILIPTIIPLVSWRPDHPVGASFF
jgi:hypothetical protein